MITSLRTLLCVAGLLCHVLIFAQFTIKETFRGSTSTGITLGGSATLTSGNADPAGDGWLRLTPATTNQLGFGVVDASFPSTLGVLVDFEYTAWHPSTSGADGFCVFLYNAATATFSIGGAGGSLGYAQNSGPPIRAGLSGGYLGIGVDEFGNYSSTVNGKTGGPGNRSNSVAVRGPAPNYAYITGTQIITVDFVPGDNGGVDYNSLNTTRPSQSQFYRRLQFELTPSGSNYTLTVRWKKSPTTGFITLFGPTLITTPPPANLKVGFSASTGSSINNHEIRNLIITTPGNVSVNKTAPLVTTFSGPTALPYTITISNGTAGTVTGINLNDQLPAGYTATVSNITINNNGNATNTISGLAVSAGGAITGSVTLAARNELTLTVNGTLNTYPAGGTLNNTATVGSGNITETDLTNNTAQVTTTVINALPVTLKDLKATRKGKEIVLEWSTAMEENFSHFDLERSQNGQSFSLLKAIKGNGASGQQRYTYTDKDAPTGPVFYRLNMVDKNGASSYSRIVQLYNNKAGEWKLYPNPAFTQTTIFVPDEWQNRLIDWSLVNAQGSIVSRGSSNTADRVTLPVSTIPVGKYTILLQQRSGKQQKTLSLVVTH